MMNKSILRRTDIDLYPRRSGGEETEKPMPRSAFWFLAFLCRLFLRLRFLLVRCWSVQHFLTAFSKVVGGSTIGLPWRPAGLGVRRFCWLFFMLHVFGNDRNDCLHTLITVLKVNPIQN